MLEKLLLRKFWKIMKKTSLVVFLLKNWSCPIGPLITIRKLILLQIFPKFVSRILKLVGERLWWNHFLTKQQKLQGFATLSKNLTSAWYVPKSSSSRNLGKSPFNKSCRLTVESLNATKNELLVKFVKGALKFTENFQELISNGFPYQKFTNLQTAAVSLASFYNSQDKVYGGVPFFRSRR